MSSSIEYIKAGKLRALAVTTADPFGRRCRTSRPWVISCRASKRARGTASARPRIRRSEIVEKLNNEINAALADPKIKARLADVGGTVLRWLTPRTSAKLIADGTEKWGKVIRAANIKPE